MSYYNAMIVTRSAIHDCVRTGSFQISKRTLVSQNGLARAFSAEKQIISSKNKSWTRINDVRNISFLRYHLYPYNEDGCKLNAYLKRKDVKSTIRNVSQHVHKERPFRHNKARIDTKNNELSLKDIEALYPAPKNAFDVFYDLVRNDLNLSEPCISNYTEEGKKHDSYWKCEHQVTWPENASFIAVEKNKQLAARAAALKCLQWLHESKKIKKGKPVIYDRNEIRQLMDQTEVVQVDSNILQRAELLIRHYKEDLEDHVTATLQKKTVNDSNNIKNLPNYDVIAAYTESPSFRNDELLDRMLDRKAENTEPYPIYQCKDEIMKVLNSNQVLLITGDTGSGKSTQVPQIIMDHFTRNGKASNCNIVICEPRRLSAISLAERVASERGEHLGDVVGYQVRLDQVRPKTPGAIFYCTTGVLRVKMQWNPGLLGISHVILDEAHERTVDIDILMVLLKKAITLNPELKLILMSATLNASLFQQYFKCPAVEVSGRMFPVTMHFLDDISQLQLPPSTVPANNDIFYGGGLKVNIELIVDLINWIDMNKPPGAILCFLPGWGDIRKVKALLESHYLKKYRLTIPLHSKLSYIDQSKIFESAHKDKRKIILATNIAETGITVKDVVYVVDCALQKELIWDPHIYTSCMKNTQISKANLKQRKGRAGRIQPGESYHLISREQYEELENFPVAAILKTSLEKTILDCKVHSSEKAETFLSNLPQPPLPIFVKQAVGELQKLEALDKDENLTALGKILANLTIQPQMGKALILSKVFECVSPMSTIAAAFCLNSEIFIESLENKSAIRNIKRRFQPASDHLSISWIFTQWLSMFENDNFKWKQFCEDNHILAIRVNNIQKFRERLIYNLKNSRAFWDEEDKINGNDWQNLESSANTYANMDELLRGLILASTDNLLRKKAFTNKNNRIKGNDSIMITENKSRGIIGSSSVNYKRKTWPSPYLTYYRKAFIEERNSMVFQETSLLSPLSVLLFCPGGVLPSSLVNKDGRVNVYFEGKANVKLECDPNTAKVLIEFREMMWNIAKYEISHHDPVYSKKVNYIKQMMLQILAAMLSKAASEIDVCKPLTEDNDGLDESSDVMISNEEDDESTDAIISDEDDEPTIVISDDEEEIVN